MTTLSYYCSFLKYLLERSFSYYVFDIPCQYKPKNGIKECCVLARLLCCTLYCFVFTYQ